MSIFKRRVDTPWHRHIILKKFRGKFMYMKFKRITLALALVPVVISPCAAAEEGFTYNSSESVWRTGSGECLTTSYRDTAPADASCSGETAEGDADNDGVVDSRDQCPGTPAYLKVDAGGCELDGDGDGVGDSKDECLKTPANAKVNAAGCAIQIVLQNIQFEHSSDKISSEYIGTLDGIAESLKSRSDLTSIEIVGHTDSIGAADYNQALSERRAQAVADYLAAQGVKQWLLTARGMGESSPIADNITTDGRTRNRRVELKLD